MIHQPQTSIRALCRVIIVDEHQAVRELLGEALSRTTCCRYKVLAMGGSVREAVDLCRRLQPDVLVIEMILPDGNGVEVLSQLRGELPLMRVVFFTGSKQTSLVTQALGLGASGYVLKRRPLRTLIEVIAGAGVGARSIDPALLIEQPKRNGDGPHPRWLTNREREVARLIAQGRTTKEAAALLGVSTKTLDKHRSNLMRKLRVHDAVGVTHYAISSGLIVLD